MIPLQAADTKHQLHAQHQHQLHAQHQLQAAVAKQLQSAANQLASTAYKTRFRTSRASSLRERAVQRLQAAVAKLQLQAVDATSFGLAKASSRDIVDSTLGARVVYRPRGNLGPFSFADPKALRE